MIVKASADPMPVPYKQMAAESLAESITFALKDDVETAVQKMAGSIAEGEASGNNVRGFEQKLELDEIRCHLCPERLALVRQRSK